MIRNFFNIVYISKTIIILYYFLIVISLNDTISLYRVMCVIESCYDFANIGANTIGCMQSNLHPSSPFSLRNTTLD